MRPIMKWLMGKAVSSVEDDLACGKDGGGANVASSRVPLPIQVRPLFTNKKGEYTWTWYSIASNLYFLGPTQ